MVAQAKLVLPARMAKRVKKACLSTWEVSTEPMDSTVQVALTASAAPMASMAQRAATAQRAQVGASAKQVSQPPMWMS